MKRTVYIIIVLLILIGSILSGCTGSNVTYIQENPNLLRPGLYARAFLEAWGQPDETMAYQDYQAQYHYSGASISGSSRQFSGFAISGSVTPTTVVWIYRNQKKALYFQEKTLLNQNPGPIEAVKLWRLVGWENLTGELTTKPKVTLPSSGTAVLLTEKKTIYSDNEIREWYNAATKREWKKISESEHTTYCYDKINISYPSQDVVRIYSITYYESKKAINDMINQYQQLGLSTKGYENLYGTISLQEVNCNNKMYLPILSMDYDKNRNWLHQSWNLSSNGWNKIPSTIPTLEKLYKVVCPGEKE